MLPAGIPRIYVSLITDEGLYPFSKIINHVGLSPVFADRIAGPAQAPCPLAENEARVLAPKRPGRSLNPNSKAVL